MARTKALSAGQRWVLNTLDNGGRIALWRGGIDSDSAFMHYPDKSRPSDINVRTVYALVDRGYLQEVESDWRRTIYTISPAGIEALGAK